MKESRVNKFKDYRDSITNEDRKVFLAPSKEKKVSLEAGLFLKVQRKKWIEIGSVFAICLTIILLLVIYGIKLF